MDSNLHLRINPFNFLHFPILDLISHLNAINHTFFKDMDKLC